MMESADDHTFAPSSNGPPVQDVAGVAGRLGVGIVLLTVCAAGPWLLSNRVSPWLGLVASLAAFPAWAYLRPRSQHLLLFVLSLWGWAFVAGGFLACLIRAVALGIRFQ